MSDSFDFKVRVEEKQAARRRDEEALASGEKSREELRRENGWFVFPDAKVELKAVAR
ncbi:MAG: hypothetical protein IPK82_43240 [Polyangiaceae bacterium]|nr:hypothetical protein [Polyangiaceae bacterium]